MKILYISARDIPGARFNGLSITERSPINSFESRMLVWDKLSSQPNVHSLRPNFCSLDWLLFHSQYFVDGLLGMEASLISTYNRIRNHPCFQWADIVHLQLTHSQRFFNPLSLCKLSQLKPIVWTLHDCWPFTGGCIHSCDCQKWISGCSGWCPHPRSFSPLRNMTPAILWKMKRNAFQKSNLELIVASSWMEDRMRQSPLFENTKYHKIPFGVDLEFFHPTSKIQTRVQLGINPNHHVIMFRGGSIDEDQFKGLRVIKSALQHYAPLKPTTLIILNGSDDFRELSSQFTIHHVSYVDEKTLVSMFSAADIFLMPSLQESFGVMAIEAMACGVPVVVFPGTALPETIGYGRGGIVVSNRKSEALADEIKAILINDSLRSALGKQARTYAEENYSFEKYFQSHCHLYKETLDRWAEQHPLQK